MKLKGTIEKYQGTAESLQQEIDNGDQSHLRLYLWNVANLGAGAEETLPDTINPAVHHFHQSTFSLREIEISYPMIRSILASAEITVED